MKTRLRRLEKVKVPPRPRELVVLEEGRYYLAGEEITEAELAELEERAEVLVCKIVYAGDPPQE